jgi:hypothetical protein
MRSLLVFFAILLAILTLISSLGGSLSAKETFYSEPVEDVEGWQETTPEMPTDVEETTTDVEPPTTEGFEDAPVDEVEPFEADENMHATF